MSKPLTSFAIALSVCLVVAPIARTGEAPSKAATSAGKVDVTVVSYASGDQQVTGYLAAPTETDRRRPAVIVVHEWWGLTDWVKQGIERFAGQGYIALGVDLYRGHSTVDAGEAHELMRGLPEDRALRDLIAAFEYLQSRPDVDPERIGAIGWCMGGGYSLVAALNIPELRSTVICYGRLSEDADALGRIGGPVLGIFGAKDRGISVESVQAFESTVKDLGKPIEVHVYPNSGHAFMNPGNETGYNMADAEDAWRQIDAFLKRTLKSPPGR